MWIQEDISSDKFAILYVCLCEEIYILLIYTYTWLPNLKPKAQICASKTVFKKDYKS